MGETGKRVQGLKLLVWLALLSEVITLVIGLSVGGKSIIEGLNISALSFSWYFPSPVDDVMHPFAFIWTGSVCVCVFVFICHRGLYQHQFQGGFDFQEVERVAETCLTRQSWCEGVPQERITLEVTFRSKKPDYSPAFWSGLKKRLVNPEGAVPQNPSLVLMSCYGV